MSLRYRWQRLQDVARAVRLQRELQQREHWTREQIEAWQRQRLAAIVVHASRHAPFYRHLYGAAIDAEEVKLESLPVITKAQMMDNFDACVTDPRLRRDELDAHLANLQGDALYLNEYRVMASSGSTGRKGIYVFDRREWSHVLAGSMRWSEFMGVKPTWPRRTRFAAIGAPDAKHMTFRGAASIDIGVFKTERMSASLTLAELVRRLNAFQPDVINAYPSLAAQLAREQSVGRLQIAPRVVCTASELRTEEMTQRIRAAWQIEPFNCLGLSETGVAAVDCAEHAGLHIFEDQCILEVVDAANRPVPPGEAGEKLLVTSLFRRTQPIIRMEVSDLLTVTDAPCRCGRTFKRIAVHGGRADDILELPAAAGGTVSLHPIHLRSVMSKIAGVSQYQIEQLDHGLEVRMVAQHQAQATIEQVKRDLVRALVGLGAAVPQLHVRAVEHIEREAGAGKFKLIKARRPNLRS